ncbi:MAG: hypothetical protein KDB01_04545 [Planctomycetaceae bacterium]|nr:hypothetical protein [Planctomycetaceae bacterium]
MANVPISLEDLTEDLTFIGSDTPQDQNHESAQRSFAEQFLSSFLNERNIRWLLVVGAAIVFGSSLMLVTKAWPDWSPVLKYLSILGYTAAAFVFAELGRRRLKLQATYKVLYALTLLLLPTCFMSLMWLSAGTSTQQTLQTIEVIGLLLPAIGFLWIASRQILDHLLNGRQTTFLNSYRLLCVAGVLPRFSSEVSAFAFLLCCWAVFTAGVIKVNRHTFWLAEEHRFPRVFGFLPILMLGLQFLILTGTRAVSALPPQWIGFSCVLVAFTILMTSRTVAGVFRQRTGNLVQRLPWTVVVPLISGVALMVLGVGLSLTGFSPVGQTTYSVIPTAAIASVLMWMMAKDFRSSGFVWISLVLAAISYQCSATLFADVVQAVKAGAASAIREDRLPVAFYGLTYLPLLAAVAAGSRRFELRGDLVFSQPMKEFATWLSGFLFAVSLTHTKAAFLVGIVDVPVFLCLAIAFRDRRYIIPSILALVIAIANSIPALASMGLVTFSPGFIPSVLAGLALLMTSTRVPDQVLNRIPLKRRSIRQSPDSVAVAAETRSLLMNQADGTDRNMFQLMGCLLAVLMSFHWSAISAVTFQRALTAPQILEYAFLLGALLLYTLRNPRYLSGLGFWTMVAVGGFRYVFGLNLSWLALLNYVTVASVGTSLLAYTGLRLNGLLQSGRQFAELRFRSVADYVDSSGLPEKSMIQGIPALRAKWLLVPLCDLSLSAVACLVTVVHLPLLVRIHASIFSASMAIDLPFSTGVAVLWLVGVSLVLRSRVAASASMLTLPLWVTAVLISSLPAVGPVWLPVIWATIYGTALLGCQYVLRRNTAESAGDVLPAIPIDTGISSLVAGISEAALMALLLLSCLSFELPLRLAAGIAIAVTTIVDRRQFMNTSRRTWLAIMVNVQVFLLMAALGGCLGSIANLFRSSDPASLISLTFVTAALSVAAFDRMSSMMAAAICRFWATLLRSGMVVLAAISLVGHRWSPEHIMLMMAGFVVAFAVEIVQAVRHQREAYVWSGLMIAGTGLAFLAARGIVHFGAGLSQLVLLTISILALIVAKVAESKPRLQIVRRPLYLIGQACPALVACLAVGRELAGLNSGLASGNAMALMLASAIYFQQAMVTRRRRFAVAAITILNVGLMLLWKSMHLNHAEFYLVPLGLSILGFVELLGKNLPRQAHDPMRYAGALTILVSPVFDILDGSWGHVFSLLLLSVVVIILAIGLRLKSLIYTGSAFLLTDLIVMVIRSGEAYPFVPWLCGIAVGIGVIGLAAFCENHREKVLARIRLLSAELATWR